MSGPIEADWREVESKLSAAFIEVQCIKLEINGKSRFGLKCENAKADCGDLGVDFENFSLKFFACPKNTPEGTVWDFRKDEFAKNSAARGNILVHFDDAGFRQAIFPDPYAQLRGWKKVKISLEMLNCWLRYLLRVLMAFLSPDIMVWLLEVLCGGTTVCRARGRNSQRRFSGASSFWRCGQAPTIS